MDPPESISGAAAATPATPTTATTTTAGTTTATVTTPTTTTPRNGANTDSMVTVPLSDIQSNPENSPGDWRSSDVPPIPPVDIDSLTEQQQQQQHDHGLKSGDVGGPPLRSPSSERNDTSDVEGDVVDWAQLDKTEEQEPRGDSSDESTALLLARLEQENNALATNPKSGLGSTSSHTKKRSQSLNHIKRLIKDDSRSSLRYSQLPPPPMTELEFWAALVSDYHSTAQRLPTLTTNKIRGGVPPPLRGVVWPSLAGARDSSLLVEYQRLCGETSPYEGLIGKDIGRSFPTVDMFRDPNGEGQQMLARVLKCFSLYDTKIGYCQGLGFVVGPLLMHMTDAEAFCVLVRLMDHYNLRNCYLPDLSGLHLHVYQFQNLLSRHRPALFAHLESLHVEPVYVSQWFLSFFAVACPLPMLLRIYDIIFLEGACETLMRVALSLMQRNEKKIMACTEFEDVMQLLLSRSLWDTYACHADDLVNDFVSLTSLVTKESLQTLEASYNQSQGVPTGISFPQMQQAASRFLGRFWAGSNSHKSFTLNPNNNNHNSTSNPTIRRSTSKQSLTSTLNSVESSSDASTAATELSAESQKSRTKSAMSSKDRDMHTQIEDLLMALSDLQRQQADLGQDLQLEREEREEDQGLARSLLNHIKSQSNNNNSDAGAMELVTKAEERFALTSQEDASPTPDTTTTTSDQTKHQLQEDLKRYKEMYQAETSRSQGLTRRLEEQERENTSLQEELREARGRIQDGYRDRQRLEHMVRELRSIKTDNKPPKTPPEQSAWSPLSDRSAGDAPTPTNGLRELKLVRSNSSNAVPKSASAASKRSSGLGLKNLITSEEDTASSPEENLLVELVNAKTAEAVAKQELEEVKGKFDSLRRMLGNSSNQQQQQQQKRSSIESINSLLNISPTSGGLSKTATEPASATSTGGGFWSGWGRRAVSGTSTNEPAEAK